MGEYLSGFAEVVTQYDVIGAFGSNLRLTLFSGLAALVIGVVLAAMRVSPAPSLRLAGAAYVTLVRNTPLTLVVVFCSLVLWGQLDIQLVSRDQAGWLEVNSFRLAVLGLAAYTGAFVCEALRSGVNTVPVGQAEAARAIGLGFTDSMRLIILPQAFRGSVAPLGNTLIALAKNTTVAQAAGVFQASSVMNTMIEFHPQYIVAIFLTFALGFIVIVLPMGLLATYVSRKAAVRR